MCYNSHTMAFRELPSQPKYPQLEEKILKFWQKNRIFAKSLQQTRQGKPYVFYEGPPTANGKPHIGHVLARSFKDLFPRFKTMQGFYVSRKAGWDSHGLPVELEVEKELGISSKQEIEEFGIAKFNQLCRESVFRYINSWEKMTKRMGFWLDLEDPYIVLEPSYIESLWWFLKEAWKNKLLVRDYKVAPYCPRCQTPISSHELSQGYRENVRDISLFVKFRVLATPSSETTFPLAKRVPTYLVAWTTTPWTLLGNVALAVNPQATYVEIKKENANENLILAKERLPYLVSSDKEFKVLREFPGEQLVGLSYAPLYDFIKYSQKAHFVVPADFVSLDEGSGIVHTAVMYGEEDFQLGQKFNLPRRHVVDEKGRFLPQIKKFAGKNVWEAGEEIIADLKSRGSLYRFEVIYHTYPYCWRCKTKLIYYALESFFIKMTKIKDKLLKNNSQVNWRPQHLKKGRMGEWLKNIKDWNISRWRYWGTPLPIWHCQNCAHDEVIGSFSELQGKALQKLDLKNFDPHRPYIDEITLRCPHCQEEMQRYEDVVDTWMDSGGMPYAQWHYPFENQDKFKEQFPADFICEGIDQTRGWFYTLLAEATVLDLGPPYKTVLATELVLDEKGRKMSKSVGNVIDPDEIFNKFGADILRWYFYSSSQIGKPYRLGERELEEVRRRFFNPLWNSHLFFITNANLDKWTPEESHPHNFRPEELVPHAQATTLDKWMLSRVNHLIKQVTQNLEDYDAFAASNAIARFVVNDLSQWYIRRSRTRVGPTVADTPEKVSFYHTAYFTFFTLAQLLAPLTPFLAEVIYQNLRRDHLPESVHLTSWPNHNPQLLNLDLEKQMEIVREIVEKGHAARKKAKIKVRQPLRKLFVFHRPLPSPLGDELKKLILEELNLKEVEFKQERESKELRVKLDTQITPELKEEGYLREIQRTVQSLRRQGGYRFDEKIILYYSGTLQLERIITKFAQELKEKLLAEELRRTDPEDLPQPPHPRATLNLDGDTLQLAVTKT